MYSLSFDHRLRPDTVVHRNGDCLATSIPSFAARTSICFCTNGLIPNRGNLRCTSHRWLLSQVRQPS